MIDVQFEKLIPLAEACRLVLPGRGGRRTHLRTLLRWVLKGSKAPGGQLVRLEACRVGSRWMTTAAALQRFSEALTPQLGETTRTPTPRTEVRRRRAAERAGKELESMGI